MVIPTCRRNELLSRCLSALAPGRQTLPPAEYQVIVSDDSPGSAARELIENQYSWARYVAGPRRGPASNRNRGAHEGVGEWLAFIDDDCQADPGWLTAIAGAGRDQSVDVIEGKTICPGKRDHPFEEHVENLGGGVFWSCNLAVRREVFNRLKGFDEDFLAAGGEDMEFAWRLKQASIPSRFVPEALVVHPPRAITWRQVWWRTFLVRWILLYRLKTKQSAPRGSSALIVALDLIRDRILELLRTSRQVCRASTRGSWKRPVFYQAWKWLTFPIVLPYLLYWEFRFRRQLLEGEVQAGGR